MSYNQPHKVNSNDGNNKPNHKQRKYKPHYRKNQKPNADATSNAGYLAVKEFMNHIPRFTMLDVFPVPSTRIYDEIIEDYFDDWQIIRHPKLSNPGNLNMLENAMYNVYGRKSVLFCLDVEAWEFNQKIVTEIGISIFDPRQQMYSMYPTILQIHILIKEHIEKKNGRFVPDHSKNFNGGTTYIMSQKDAVIFTQGLVEYFFFKVKNIKCSLVGHNVKGDIAWLQELGISFPEKYEVIDTQSIFALSNGQNGSSLKNGLKMMNLPHSFLHNAGNDAYFTLLLAMKLCDPTAREYHCLDSTIQNTIKASSVTGERQIRDQPGKNRRARVTHLNISQFVEIDNVIDVLKILFLDEMLPRQELEYDEDEDLEG